jgi:hypothetical protein
MSDESTVAEENVEAADYIPDAAPREVKLPEGRMPRDELMRKLRENTRAAKARQEEEEQELAPSEDDEEAGDGVEQEEEDDSVVVKVDGVEQRVPRDKVLDAGIRTYQKEAAADKRLQDASARIRQLEAYEQQLREREAKLNEQLPQKDAAPQQDDDGDDDAYRRAAEALYSGDEEEAAKALKLLVNSGRSKEPTQSFDTNRIVQEAVALTRYEMALESAKESFFSEYSEIVEDPVLYRLADENSAKLQDEHPDWSPKQILMESGKLVRDWVNTHGGGNHAEAEPSNKEERKRNIKPVRSAGGSIPRKQEPRPPTRSDIVQQMRKSRGLPE